MAFRVRVRNKRQMIDLEIEWYKMYFIKSSQPGKKLDLRSTRIRKGKGNAYPLGSIFKYAKEWEKPFIEETEAKLA